MRNSLAPELVKALDELKFDSFTKVQELAIPVLLSGKDAIVQSKTGTGKTAAFMIPILNRLTSDRNIQAIVLVPTRELAGQVESDCQNLGKYLRVNSVLVTGGSNMFNQVKRLRNGAQVVIGTPGRVLDLLDRKVLNLSTVKFVVLDEADIMLSMGFIEDVKKILSKTPPAHQTMLFCVDFPPAVSQLTHSALKDPERIRLVDNDKSTTQVTQVVYKVPGRQKLALLLHLLKEEQPTQSIIFCKTKRSVKMLDSLLRANNCSVMALHGDLTQYQRQRVLHAFKAHEFQFLVATDVASRGLHVDGLSHVFNFELPHDVGQFVHRIGRTGRLNATGKAITFCDPNEQYLMRDIEREIGKRLNIEPLPEGIPMPAVMHATVHEEEPRRRFQRGGGGHSRGGGRSGGGRARFDGEIRPHSGGGRAHGSHASPHSGGHSASHSGGHSGGHSAGGSSGGFLRRPKKKFRSHSS